MTTLREKLKAHVIVSMKAKNPDRTQTLRMALAAIQKKEIEFKKEPTDEESSRVLTTMMKQLQETIDQAKSLGRTETVASCEKEIAILKEYLPEMMSESDVLRAVTEIVNDLKKSGTLASGSAAVGPIMKQAMAKVGALSDGKTVQAAVKKALGL